ncbi:MAG: hypothetical protein ACLPY5_11375 [Candidatus Bathyarchaeia archaeon]
MGLQINIKCTTYGSITLLTSVALVSLPTVLFTVTAERTILENKPWKKQTLILNSQVNSE